MIILRSFLVTSSLIVALPCLGRGLTPENLASLARLSDPQVSPDASAVAFVLSETDLEANRRRTDIWLLDLGRDGAEPRRLTDHRDNDSAPQWSVDGRYIYFISSRSGSSQVWRIAANGGRSLQVTDYPVDVANLLVAPNDDRIAFTAEVFPDCETLSCTDERLKKEESDNRTGTLYDGIFVRHWDTWEDGRRSALFTVELGNNGKARGNRSKSPATSTVTCRRCRSGGARRLLSRPTGRRFSSPCAKRDEPSPGR